MTEHNNNWQDEYERFNREYAEAYPPSTADKVMALGKALTAIVWGTFALGILAVVLYIGIAIILGS